MSEFVFIDTNILMYAVGSPHRFKKPSLKVLESITEGKITAVTDTEVFQEIAYRYWHQNKWPLAMQILTDMSQLFSEIISIEKDLLPVYYSMLSEYAGISPRDAIHLAVMKDQKIKKIYTVDRDFLKIPWIEVLPF